jgi:hypothetical protein
MRISPFTPNALNWRVAPGLRFSILNTPTNMPLGSSLELSNTTVASAMSARSAQGSVASLA